MAIVAIEEVQKSRDEKFKKIGDVYFIDISKSVTASAKDLNVIRNDNAVLESVYNVLLTEPGERIMDPQFGTRLKRYLFDPLDVITARSIMREIVSALQRYEDRIADLNVIVTPKPDLNTFEIEVIFSITTNDDDITFSTTLEKIR